MGSINVNVHTAFLCGMSLFLGAYWHLKMLFLICYIMLIKHVFILIMYSNSFSRGVLFCVIIFKKHDL